MTLFRRIATILAFSAVTSAHAAMETPVAPFPLYGNSYYVGMQGIGSVLITSSEGHILIDGGFPESAAHIASGIRALGFKVGDVKLILNSHVHGDHAGGIAELQRLSGAIVMTSPASVQALRDGMAGKDDPQFADLQPFPQVGAAQPVMDGEVVRVGPLAVTAHYTPGHTRSGVSWSWTSCQQARCGAMVFADSINPISSDGFRFSANSAYPGIVQDFGYSYTVLGQLPCDVLVAAHPDAAALKAQAGMLGDGGACKRYVAASRDKLKARLASERAAAQ
ncbi:subclass B3 metallo-beta-lactamase [Pseudoduganella sp. FT55W]|uniref:beta-lactamase n=1 Tax=Duganella rivi TaxID=2666083 RepID=A0A7X4GPT2_9BURK|nr:subclass B3 metallo-beta-lactamase [Duganella rivi]MYM66419.1 subclass B3 metallo-beta-lactamase [Duganella rivi]